MANSNVPAERRIEFRVGINLGDVVVEGDDLLGDGVNVAARIEGVAEPGGICVSGSACEQSCDKLPFSFVDMGEHGPKNLARPGRAASIAVETDAAQTAAISCAPPRLSIVDDPRLIRAGKFLNLAIIIPSVGRPKILHDTVMSLRRQSVRPIQIIVSVPDESAVLPETRKWCEVIYGAKGSCRQRNRGVAALKSETEIVTFLDDDMELRDDYLENMMRAFKDNPSLMLAGGSEVADGGVAMPSNEIAPLGIDRMQAQQLLAKDSLYRSSSTVFLSNYVRDMWDVATRLTAPGGSWVPRWLVSSNNMSARRRVLDFVKFDERLPLYAWMEDYDFTLACARVGRVARVENCRMVHLGANAGRISQKRLGFVQVMNPIYIYSKRHPGYHAGAMIIFVARILIGNIVKFPANPSERWQRLQGNLLALAMAMRGDLRPEQMLEI